MKKFTSFIAVIVMMMSIGTAFAGPIDWAMEKVGYTPTSVYEQQKAEAAKAAAAAKASQAAAEASAAKAAEAAEVTEVLTAAISYGGGVMVILGGLGFLHRKDLAKKILAEK